MGRFDLQRSRWKLKLQKMRFEVWCAKHAWFGAFGRLLARTGRFAFTVFCAGLVSAWWHPQLQQINKSLAGFVETSVQLGATLVSALHEEKDSWLSFGAIGTWSGISGPSDSSTYRTHLEKTLSRLRRIQYYRMVRVDLPASVLEYQDGGSRRISARRSGSVSFIAVSKDLDMYLREKNITFIEAKRIPSRLVAGISVPLTEKTFKQTLLIPDVTGERADTFKVR
ncbi:MAG: hypothetical protein H6617_06035 [Bdellovibrionaceae bacterium]|nr:hypothetical protein [Bdellovibrionales bacterium]MCB9254223.1 hypothetical protein [Pseudobdellovibrionaceae bacterium]